MDANFLLYALSEGLKTLLLLITPVMAIPMLLGILISIFQAVTQIQDQLLNFLPKFILIILVVMIGMPFAMTTISNYFQDIMTVLPNYI